MAQIGHLTRGDDGTLTGTIRTLSLNVKARFVPAETSSNEEGPDPEKRFVFCFLLSLSGATARDPKTDSRARAACLDHHPSPE